MTTGQLLTVLVTVLAGLAMVLVPFMTAGARSRSEDTDARPACTTVLELTETTTSHPAGAVRRTRRVRLQWVTEPGTPDAVDVRRLLDPAFFGPGTTAPVERPIHSRG